MESARRIFVFLIFLNSLFSNSFKIGVHIYAIAIPMMMGASTEKTLDIHLDIVSLLQIIMTNNIRTAYTPIEIAKDFVFLFQFISFMLVSPDEFI